MKRLEINPPLLNTPCPWCRDLDQLRELYQSPHTGAVTTRTSMIDGFPDDPAVNQFVFFNPLSHQAATPNVAEAGEHQVSSLNTIGFSPYTLDEYLSFIKTISDEIEETENLKPFIVSVTGLPAEMKEAYRKITAFQDQVKMDLIMEVNLSCPNIPGKVSPAYDKDELLTYLEAFKEVIEELQAAGLYKELAIGIKTPPFTYQEQYDIFVLALLEMVKKHGGLPITFLVSTNTLGSSLLVQTDSLPDPVLASMTGTGIGGMAGAAIHPLSLGNVYTLRSMLSQHEALKDLQMIGVGGVSDINGFKRMKSVGADFVGIATALGVKGISVFEEIESQL